MAQWQIHGFISLEDEWNQIQSLFLNPLVSKLEERMNNSEANKKLFENEVLVRVHTICYNLCTQRSPYSFNKQLYERHGSFIEEYLTATVVPSLEQKQDRFLLQELIKRWENHYIMIKNLSSCFNYLNRHYVKYNSLDDLDLVGVKKFKQIVFI